MKDSNIFPKQNWVGLTTQKVLKISQPFLFLPCLLFPFFRSPHPNIAFSRKRSQSQGHTFMSVIHEATECTGIKSRFLGRPSVVHLLKLMLTKKKHFHNKLRRTVNQLTQERIEQTVKKVYIIKWHRKTVKWRRKNYWPFYSKQNAYQVGKDEDFKNT